MYVSADTVAFLLDLAPSSIRELLDDPSSGLSAQIRAVHDSGFASQDVDEGHDTRIALWDVACYVARRRRGGWDQSPSGEPSRAEIRAIWREMVAAAAVYRPFQSVRDLPASRQPERSNPTRRPATPSSRARARKSASGNLLVLGEGALPTKAAAAYTGLSPKTLETMRSRGGGPHFAKLGSRVVYRREDLDAWLAERVQRSTSDAG